MRKIFLSVLGVLGLCLLAMPAQAQWGVESSGGKSIGVNYEAQKFSIGLRGDWDNEILAIGPKCFYRFICPIRSEDIRSGKKRPVLAGYLGMEINYLSFETEKVKGNGYFIQIPLKAEYFANQNFSIYGAIGPGYVKLTDSSTKISVDEFEWAITSYGIALHF